MTCQHRVAVGAWCTYCGTVVDDSLVRELAFNPPPLDTHESGGTGVPHRTMVPMRDPDIEMFEDGHAATVGECGGCGAPVLVSVHGWTRCQCGSDTTLLKDGAR